MNEDFEKAAVEIKKLLKAEGKRVYSHKDLVTFLRLERGSWGQYQKGETVENVILELLDEGYIERVKLAHDKSKKEFIRYNFDNPSPYEVAQSLQKGAYLSHGSAVFIHGLNNQLPKTVYLNKEQSKKAPLSGQLSQGSIDRAFSKKQRESLFRLSYKDCEIVLLSGKNTGRFHVLEIEKEGQLLQVASIERTLVDITVRPNYAGGTSQVLEAYKGALGRISVNSLQAVLKKLAYVYPYHQAVGFYLERAGYPEEQITWMKERFSLQFDFYLEYAIPEKSREYSKDWCLFYPKGL